MATRQQLRQRAVAMMQAAITADSDTPDCENATDYKPPTMQVAKCPYVYTQAASGRYDVSQFESFAELLSVELVVIVTPATLGLVGQAEQEADKYFAIAQEYFIARMNTTLDGTIDTEAIEIVLRGDRGLRLVAFDNGQFFAAIINIAIASERRIENKGI